jgi:hypothetical protein
MKRITPSTALCGHRGSLIPLQVGISIGIRDTEEDPPSRPLRGKLGNIRLNDPPVDIGRLANEDGVLLRILLFRSEMLRNTLRGMIHLPNMNIRRRAYDVDFNVSLRLFLQRVCRKPAGEPRILWKPALNASCSIGSKDLQCPYFPCILFGSNIHRVRQGKDGKQHRLEWQFFQCV